MPHTQAHTVNAFAVPPSLPLAVLRTRYDALRILPEPRYAGTLLDRYLEFHGFLQHGPWLAALQRAGWDTEPVASRHPGLLTLAVEAWPAARIGVARE